MASLEIISAVPAACFSPTVVQRSVGPFPTILSVRQANRVSCSLSVFALLKKKKKCIFSYYACHSKGQSIKHFVTRKDGLILQNRSLGFRPLRSENAKAGSWEDGERRACLALESMRKMFDGLPEPAKRYPWGNAVVQFFRTVLGLVFAMAKCLSVPMLVISSLSEMSYCAYKKKMLFMPVPFLAGIAVARALKHTVMEVSSDFKEEEFPWHLLVMAAFFVLLKIPGPYYPHLGRLTIPHFANGGLWGIFWFVFQRSRKAQEAFETLGTSDE